MRRVRGVCHRMRHFTVFVAAEPGIGSMNACGMRSAECGIEGGGRSLGDARPDTPHSAFHIEPKLIHQFEAVTAADLLEASTPELDDVVRLKDRYGRVP